jgi:hypothetical protein
MQVRSAALRRFGEKNIREGAPLATIEDVLVPIYMLHRYQVEAASKLIGGMDYTFALRGDGQTATQIVAAVLATLKPEALELPEALLKIIPPRPPEYERGREDFKIRTYPAFDALAPAEAAAQHTLQFLFNPERAERLVEFHARDSTNPSLEEVFDAVLDATWRSDGANRLLKLYGPHANPNSRVDDGPGYSGEIAHVVDDVVLYDLIALAANERASDKVRAVAWLKLADLKGWLNSPPGSRRDLSNPAHTAFAVRQIELFEKDPKRLDLTPPAEPPDGPPIGAMGDADDDWLP